MSDDSIDEIVKPKMRQAYNAKCYLVQNEARKNKYSCQSVLKKHNDLYFQHYKGALDVFLKIRRDSELEDIDKAKDVGFRVYDQGMVTYKQKKLGLFACCNKHYVLTDGIQTRLLGF